MYIISDSICKPIDMVKFGNRCRIKDPIKRFYPGATASQLKYYSQATLADDKPDIMIIHVGTNNITKKRQSDIEIVSEIMDIVTHCQIGGVNEVYVSSLICRPAFQERINAINHLLARKAIDYDFIFIDNSNIKEYHLWDDSILNS